LVVIAAALSASPALAGWTVQKSEADPFAPNGAATFVAMELGEQSGLAIRCLEGKISLLLVVQASGASQGDLASVKLIADAKGVVDDDDAHVIWTTTVLNGVQFGDESTLDYLKGAQKLSLRYGLRGFTATVSFAGGKSMDGMIDKALKACGKASEPPPSVSTTAQPGSPEWAPRRMPAPARTTSSPTRTTSGPASRRQGRHRPARSAIRRTYPRPRSLKRPPAWERTALAYQRNKGL
jgi:hypothetical protein